MTTLDIALEHNKRYQHMIEYAIKKINIMRQATPDKIDTLVYAAADAVREYRRGYPVGQKIDALEDALKEWRL
jgi:UDP-N-acetylmuramoylalanine-D-glutamate ligase